MNEEKYSEQWKLRKEKNKLREETLDLRRRLFVSSGGKKDSNQ